MANVTGRSYAKEKNKIVYTPMLRFFKADYLAEIGRNNIGDLLFNFVKRF